MAKKLGIKERLNYGLHLVTPQASPPAHHHVMVVITNRSSYGKVRTVIEGLLALGVKVSLVLAGSLWLYKYGNAGEIIHGDFPDVEYYRIDSIVEGDSTGKMADSVAVLLPKLSAIFNRDKPDMVLTIADRFETMATAIAASYMNIPLAHIQGGEHTGTIDNKVRNAVTQLADYHFPATEQAAYVLGSMGLSGIYAYGCPSMDLLDRFTPDEEDRATVQAEINEHGTGDNLDLRQPYIIAMYHPDTTAMGNIDGEMLEMLDVIERANHLQVVVFWPNIDACSEGIAKQWRELSVDGPQGVKFIRHIEHRLFCRLLWFSNGIFGNSSAGIREASYYGVPSVDFGTRQRNRQCGPNTERTDMDDPKPLYEYVFRMVSKEKNPCQLYGNGRAGNRIAKKITDILEEAE